MAGASCKNTVTEARKAHSHFGTPAEVERLKTELNRTGLGNHPVMIRGLARIARLLGNASPPKSNKEKTIGGDTLSERFIAVPAAFCCATLAAHMSRIWIDILDIEAGGFQSSSELSRVDFGAEPVGIQCSCNMDMRSDFPRGRGLTGPPSFCQSHVIGGMFVVRRNLQLLLFLLSSMGHGHSCLSIHARASCTPKLKLLSRWEIPQKSATSA